MRGKQVITGVLALSAATVGVWALFVISVWAMVRPRTETFALGGAGLLAAAVPHLVFHFSQLDIGCM